MNSDTAGFGVLALLFVPILAIVVFEVAAWWKVFTKAGQPGWACLVPFYNVYLILQIAGRPGWWLLLWLIPVANVIIAIVTFVDVAKKFGKGTGFGVGLALLGPIFMPILGFGDARYQSAS